MLASFITDGKKGFFAWIQEKSASKRGWKVTPRTLPSGEREIWLTCPGEQDFLYMPAKKYEESSTQWENALFNAEVQVNDFNRLRQQGLKEIMR